MSEVGSTLPPVTQQMSPLIDDVEDSSDVSTVIDSAEKLVAMFGEDSVVGALKNMAMKDVAAFLKELVDSNDDLGDAVKDFVKDMIDVMTAKEESRTTADASDAVEDSAVGESWKDAVTDMLKDIMRMLAEQNDKENGMGSTEGEQKKPKGSSGAGGGEGAGSAEAAGGEAAGGGEGAGEAAGGEAAGEAAGGGGSEGAGGGGSAGNWLEKWAEGMAKAQINWINQADKQQQIMQEMSGKDDTASRDAFIMAQSKYTADMQMFSMTAAATSTSLKTIGEGLAGLARKQ